MNNLKNYLELWAKLHTPAEGAFNALIDLVDKSNKYSSIDEYLYLYRESVQLVMASGFTEECRTCGGDPIACVDEFDLAFPDKQDYVSLDVNGVIFDYITRFDMRYDTLEMHFASPYPIPEKEFDNMLDNIPNSLNHEYHYREDGFTVDASLEFNFPFYVKRINNK